MNRPTHYGGNTTLDPEKNPNGSENGDLLEIAEIAKEEVIVETNEAAPDLLESGPV